ncbi:hypothetical protein Peur_004155 [Populus x canadensis]
MDPKRNPQAGPKMSTDHNTRRWKNNWGKRYFYTLIFTCDTTRGLFLLGSLWSRGALPIASSCKILSDEFICQVRIFSPDEVLQTFAVGKILFAVIS